MKVCNKCNQYKADIDFYKNGKNRNTRPECKDCFKYSQKRKTFDKYFLRDKEGKEIMYITKPLTIEQVKHIKQQYKYMSIKYILNEE